MDVHAASDDDDDPPVAPKRTRNLSLQSSAVGPLADLEMTTPLRRKDPP